MSKGQIGVDASAASKISDAGAEFKLPDASPQELANMTKEEWMQTFGQVYASELKFNANDPNWADNPDSWWYQETGRVGDQQPLWMRHQYHMPDLDCPAGSDRQSEPLDSRAEKPMWAERMNLTGNKQGKQSETIYGYRREYLPTQKTGSRSMFERYQPTFPRVLNEELPDVSDPADGRFWKAGVAQGIITDPYEKRLAISGRRKPIVVGPRSISVVVDGESHTLANTVRDNAWLHPHVQFSGYSIEHPVYRHVNMRIQTSEASGISGEQALSETLEMTQNLYQHLGGVMAEQMNNWPAKKAVLDAEKEKRDRERSAAEEERDKKMQRWLAMMNKQEPWDRDLEIELYGQVISHEMEAAAS